MPIRQLVSGGQTGADRAALDVAIELGIPHGGWVPQGFLAEDGPLDRAKYPELRECDSPEPNVRTELNVRDSDATLIFSHGPLTGGSLYTLTQAKTRHKPWLHVDFEQCSLAEATGQIQVWLAAHSITVLVIAGPRESEDSGIYDEVAKFLHQLLSMVI